MFYDYMHQSNITPPAGRNTVNPFAIVPDADNFIHFVEVVFGGQELSHVRTPDRDGSIIHAGVNIGNSTIMLFERKPEWPVTSSLLQVYVKNPATCLNKAIEHDAHIVTPISDFYGGYKISRILDPWHNLWWLYEPTEQPLPQDKRHSDTDWHHRKPSVVYTSLINTMRNLTPPR